jgi:protein-disulfide isomerase
MNRTYALVLFLLLQAYLVPAARAHNPACDRLPAEQKKLAGQILQSEHPYDCCDDTIAKCLKRKPACSLAVRLAANICRRVARGEPREKIARALDRRARTALRAGKPASIKLDGVPMAGDPDAPVAVVEYACARCPYCSRITPKLYRAVTEGPLEGKVRLYLKLFPIRGHPFSKEAGLAFLAAAKLNRFWQYALYSYQHFDQYSLLKQAQWAEKEGMDARAFERIVNDPATREALIASKKEGIVNKVNATPTFFIDGKKYSGEVQVDEIIDYLEEVYERIKASPSSAPGK